MKRANPALANFMFPLNKLHLTLMVLRLETEEEVARHF